MVFEEDDLVGVEGGFDDGFVFWGEGGEVGAAEFGADGVGGAGTGREGVNCDGGGGGVGHFGGLEMLSRIGWVGL